MKNILTLLMLVLAYSLFASEDPHLSDGTITVKYDKNMHSSISSDLPGSGPVMDKYFPSEQLMLEGKPISGFGLTGWKEQNDGDSKGIVLEGKFSDGGLNIIKKITGKVNPAYPGFLMTKVTYINSGKDTLTITGWTNNYYKILPAENVEPSYWSFQGATYPDRRDWVQPVNKGFQQENYMGMNASDYGGGTPIADLWRPDIGIAVGHLETSPKLVSIPVDFSSGQDGAGLGVSYKFLESIKARSRQFF